MPIPPILFIHGAANGAWVWDSWRAGLIELGHVPIVIDLRGHGRSLPVDFTTMTMDDYVADVESVVPQVAARYGVHPVIAGWSMGGLVAMMYAALHPETPALALFAPSPPVEVAGRADPERVRATPSTAYGPELYGIYPDDVEKSLPALADLTADEAARVLAASAGAQESGFARRQRLRGISVPAESVTCPSLVIAGSEDRAIAADSSKAVAGYLNSLYIEVPGAGHWGPIVHQETVTDLARQLDGWLQQCLNGQ